MSPTLTRTQRRARALALAVLTPALAWGLWTRNTDPQLSTRNRAPITRTTITERQTP